MYLQENVKLWTLGVVAWTSASLSSIRVELLKQSIQNTEMLTKVINEQNAVLRQQTQQIKMMLQWLTNMLSKK